MVFYIQIEGGRLVQIKSLTKATKRAKHLLAKHENPAAKVYLITGKDSSEVAGGWGIKRELRLPADPAP